MSAEMDAVTVVHLNVLTFPDRGGAGWRCDPKATWGSLDMTNVSIAASAFWQKHGASGYAVLGMKATAAMLEDAALAQAVALAQRGLA